MGGYVADVVETEPGSYEEAASQQISRDAMVEEYASIMKNDVWEIVPRPKGKSVVTSRWLYKIKNVANGSVEKFKARFLAWGFSQVEGVDYEETFAPIAQYTSIRAVISIAAKMGWTIHWMDVNIAFLNGVIQEEVYIKQPQAFKQMGFQKSDADPNLYFIMVGDDPLIQVLYVYNLFIAGEDRLIQHCKRDLASEFDMTGLGLMHYFFKLEVWQEDGHIFMGQGKYAEDILERFCMEGCMPMAIPMITNWKKMHASNSELVNPTLYRHLISSLMYLVNTRLDICFTINTLSQFRMELGRVHWVAAKHVLRYLQGVVDYGLDYIRGDGVRLTGCTDSNWARSPSESKSTSRCCFMLGSATVSWFSKNQRSMALSSTEVEYIAASQASCEAIWFRKMVCDLFGQRLRPTTIYCDN
eukprot:PITA_12596